MGILKDLWNAKLSIRADRQTPGKILDAVVSTSKIAGAAAEIHNNVRVRAEYERGKALDRKIKIFQAGTGMFSEASRALKGGSGK